MTHLLNTSAARRVSLGEGCLTSRAVSRSDRTHVRGYGSIVRKPRVVTIGPARALLWHHED